MRDHCNGGIVAVDVSPPVDLLVDCEDRDSLGFLGYVRHKFFGPKGTGPIPHLIEILMRTGFLSSIHHREEMSKHADLLIHPPMSGYGLLDWGNLETLVEIGYQTTRERLKHWTDPATLRTTGEHKDTDALFDASCAQRA
jgi:predicted acylesterase/phospholipase RssA